MKNNQTFTCLIFALFTAAVAQAQFDTPETVQPAGSNLHVGDLIAIDYTGDGHIDLIGRYNDKIIIYENLGGGEFAEPETVFQIPVPITRFIMFDIDNDGDLDFLLATSLDLLLYKNDGAGFTLAQTTPGNMVRLSSFDINGDGFEDVVAVEGSVFKVYINDGAGELNLNSSTDVDMFLGPFHGEGTIAYTDVNNDGYIDIIFTHSSSAGYLANNGDHTFTTYDQLVTSETWARTVRVVDFDLDGDDDLLFLFGGSDWDWDDCGTAKSALILLNKNEAGTYDQSNLNITNRREYQQLHVSDMNGNGYPDIVASYYYVMNWSEACYTHRSGVQVMVNNGDGSAANQLYHTGFGFDDFVFPYITGHMALADFTGNGYDDMAFSVPNLSFPGPAFLSNDGSLSAGLNKLYYVDPGMETMALFAADMTGDGQKEIVHWTREIRNDFLLTYDRNGPGDYNSEKLYLTSQATFITSNMLVPQSVAVSDVTGDGLADAIFISVVGPSQREVVAAINHGDGTWTEETVVAETQEMELFGVDLNNDGKDEIVVVVKNVNNHVVSAYTRSVSGGYEPFGDSYSVSGKFSSLSFGDVNGDGFPDISSVLNENSIGIALSDGTGGILEILTLNLDPTIGLQHELIDLNVDGFADLVVWKADGSIPIRYFQNDGNLSFSSVTVVKQAGTYKRFVHFGDLYNNGIPQLVFLSQSGNLVWKENDGNGNSGNEVVILGQGMASDVTHITMGDFTNDGATDLALARSGTALCPRNFDVHMLPSLMEPGTPVNDNIIEPSDVKPISVYPVPSRGLLYIDFAEYGNFKTRLVLTDLTGKVLKSANVSGPRFEWSLDHLSSGMYILQLYEGSELRHAQKVVMER